MCLNLKEVQYTLDKIRRGSCRRSRPRQLDGTCAAVPDDDEEANGARGDSARPEGRAATRHTTRMRRQSRKSSQRRLAQER